MNYSCYKEAFSALVQENDGVLPDLYDKINLTISCHPLDAPILSTVADVVAYAIIEISNDLHTVTTVSRSPLLLPVPAHASGELIDLEQLLTQAATYPN